MRLIPANSHKLLTYSFLFLLPVFFGFTTISNSDRAKDLPVSSPIILTGSEEVVSLYIKLDLEKSGLSFPAFDYAMKGYHKLMGKGLLKKTEVLSICDFSQSSSNKRFYAIDLNNQELLFNTYVAHGKRSGTEFASRFSNIPRSHQSSLGFYTTLQTYYGEHGLSLNLKGLERGYNDKALARRIVIHGSDYATESFIENNNYLGRSFGCPALPKSESEEIINTIKDGSCLFIYHPSSNYIKNSKILNG